jgi:3-oxoacyl-[acyl-carrier protein] reductase
MIVCSGICPFDDWMAADWDEVYERTNAVNVKGTVNCVRAALPAMMERGGGRIVLVGSLAGRTGGLLSGPHYVASKGAVGALVRADRRAAQRAGQRRRSGSGRYQHDRRAQP